MEDLDFFKKWCLTHLKFDKEIILKSDFLNQDAKDELIEEVHKVEEKVLIYYNNKNIRKLKFFFKSFNQDACQPDDPGYSMLNAYLRAACGKDLRDFDTKRLEKVKKLEERGYIKTNSEYYLIRNHIDYLEATNASDEEIIKFDTLISLYEEKIKEKMERQKKREAKSKKKDDEKNVG